MENVSGRQKEITFDGNTRGCTGQWEDKRKMKNGGCG